MHVWISMRMFVGIEAWLDARPCTQVCVIMYTPGYRDTGVLHRIIAEWSFSLYPWSPWSWTCAWPSYWPAFLSIFWCLPAWLLLHFWCMTSCTLACLILALLSSSLQFLHPAEHPHYFRLLIQVRDSAQVVVDYDVSYASLISHNPLTEKMMLLLCSHMTPLQENKTAIHNCCFLCILSYHVTHALLFGPFLTS